MYTNIECTQKDRPDKKNLYRVYTQIKLNCLSEQYISKGFSNNLHAVVYGKNLDHLKKVNSLAKFIGILPARIKKNTDLKNGLLEHPIRSKIICRRVQKHL